LGWNSAGVGSCSWITIITIQNMKALSRIFSRKRKNPDFYNFSFLELIELLNKTRDLDQKTDIAIGFLQANNRITFSDLGEILKLTEPKFRSNIAAQFIKRYSNYLDFTGFVEVLKLIDQSQELKELATSFLTFKKISVKQLGEILKLVDVNQKCEIFHYFRKYEKIVSADFILILQSIDDPAQRLDFAKQVLTVLVVNQIECTALPKFLELFDDKQFKLQLILDSINVDEKLSLLAQVLEDDDIRYDTKRVYDLAVQCLPYNSQTKAKQINDFAASLYSGAPVLRIKIFEAAVEGRIVSDHNLKDLNFDGVEDDDFLDFIKFARDTIALSENVVFDLVKSRANSKYNFLTDVLDQTPINEFLTPNGISHLTDHLGLNLEQILQIKPSQLFSYFDILGQTPELKSLLTPEFLQKAQQRFYPSDRIFITYKNELRKLSELLDDNSVQIAASYLQGQTLCDYFATFIPPNLTAKEKQGYKINFGDDQKKLSEEQKELNRLFQELLLSPDRDLQKIKAFFIKAGLDDSTIDNKNWEKISGNFYQSPDKFAYIFSRPDGLSRFIAIASAVNEGSSANIGNQFNILVYRFLCEGKPADGVMFDMFDQEVIRPILNSDIEVMILIKNPLEVPKIKDCYLSPDALLKKVAECFIKKDTINQKVIIQRDAAKFIKQNLAHDTKTREQIVKLLDFEEEIAKKIERFREICADPNSAEEDKTKWSEEIIQLEQDREKNRENNPELVKKLKVIDEATAELYEQCNYDDEKFAKIAAYLAIINTIGHQSCFDKSENFVEINKNIKLARVELVKLDVLEGSKQRLTESTTVDDLPKSVVKNTQNHILSEKAGILFK
jgi:hypothetical protein